MHRCDARLRFFSSAFATFIHPFVQKSQDASILVFAYLLAAALEPMKRRFARILEQPTVADDGHRRRYY